MLKTKIHRTYFKEQTLGRLELFDKEKLVFSCYTMERPWADNKIGYSCIPEGTYKVKYHNSPKFKRVCPWVQGTEPRKWILIHPGNMVTQIEGCIMPGKALADINGDGLLDVTSSKVAFNEYMKLLDGREYVLELVEAEDKYIIKA